MGRSGVHISICGNDAREVLADWLIAKKPRDFLKKIRSVGNQGGRSHSIWTVPLQVTKLFQDKKLRSLSRSRSV
jgi:hypothetical protein